MAKIFFYKTSHGVEGMPAVELYTESADACYRMRFLNGGDSVKVVYKVNDTEVNSLPVNSRIAARMVKFAFKYAGAFRMLLRAEHGSDQEKSAYWFIMGILEVINEGH